MKNDELLTNYRKYQALWIFAIYALGIAFAYHFLYIIRIEYLGFSLLLLLAGSLLSYFSGKKIFLYFIIPLLFLSAVTRAYFDAAAFDENYLLKSDIIGQRVTVKGWISEAHYRKDGKSRYILRCESIRQDSIYREASGDILLVQGRYGRNLEYGDEIEAELRLTLPALPRNPGEFNYRRYLQMKNVYLQAGLPEKIEIIGKKGNFLVRYLLNPLRMKILSVIDFYAADPANSIMKAIILGEKQDIDKTIIGGFQKTGVIHVLAISGLHVGLILMMFLLFFSIMGLSNNWSIGISLALIALYTALVNFTPSVVRAALMAILYYGARCSQRKVQPLNILGAAGLIILLVNPRQLFSMGFQFSFLSVFSILYGYPRLSKLWNWSAERKRWRYLFNRWVRQPILVSISAVLGIMPLTWYYFGVLQFGAILFNLFIIPLFALFLLLSIVFLLLAIPALPGAFGAAYMANELILFIINIVERGARLSFIQIYLFHPSILLAGLLMIFILFLYNVGRKEYRVYWFIGLLLLGYLALKESRISDKKLRVTYTDVGQGDGAIIEFPSGETAVIDGGDRKFNNDAGRRFMIPLLKYYGIHHITYLIGTHSHSDHIGGLISIMRQIKTDTLVLNRYIGKTKLYAELLTAAEEEKVTLLYRGRGEQLRGIEGVRFYILHPDSVHTIAKSYSGNEINNSSLVIKLCYGKTSFLFTGDLEQNAENCLLKYGSFLKSDVLKVGHHGSKTSTSLSFLRYINPDYSIVSVGKRNKFYHPSRITMERLRKFGAHPFRTDHFGALTFVSGGEKIRLVNWRK
jgi:competence protein ComEC